MERQFKIGDFETWIDWDLILTSKDVTPPEPKSMYVDIDGMDGSLDLSESLTGGPVYKDRTVSATFWTDRGSRKDRSALIRDIVNNIHGKKLPIIEPDDPDHYFLGRVKVKDINNIIPYATISIEATCEPWRYLNEDITRYFKVNSLDPTALVFTNEGAKTVCPEIKITGAITLMYDGIETQLSAGVYKISDLKFKQGKNVVEVSGSGSVTFTYKEADL